jgi:hypothetical protein
MFLISDGSEHQSFCARSQQPPVMSPKMEQLPAADAVRKRAAAAVLGLEPLDLPFLPPEHGTH